MRRARGTEPLAYSILLHGGAILAGVIDARRPTFDVFGDVLDETLWLSQAAAQGEVTVSAVVAGRLGASARLVAAEPLQTHRGGIEVLRAERTAG